MCVYSFIYLFNHVYSKILYRELNLYCDFFFLTWSSHFMLNADNVHSKHLVAPVFLPHPSDQSDIRQSSAEELPVALGEVDLVTAMTAAHWFDRQKFLVEADRVLRPGGCLALLSYTLDMKLEYGDVTDTLNDICKEVRPHFEPCVF